MIRKLIALCLLASMLVGTGAGQSASSSILVCHGNVVVGGGGGGGGTTASMNLSGGHAVCNVGSAEIGNLTPACDVTITNNTGSPYTFTNINVGVSVSQTNQSVHWTFQGSARGYKDDCTGTSSTGTQVLNPGASCHLNAYGVPATTGSGSGLVYLTDPSGNRLSDITVNFTGVPPTNISSVDLPIGVTKNTDGTYSGYAYKPPYPGDGTCAFTVSTAAGLTSALSSVTQGQTICITSGSVIDISGTLTLRNTGNAAASWIVIRPDSGGSYPSGLPAYGSTANPGLRTSMATIRQTAAANIFTCANGAHHYWITGLELTTSGSTADALDTIFCAPTSPSTLSDFPHDVAFERNYTHPDFTRIVGGMSNGMHGFEMDVVNGYVGNNYIVTAGLAEYQGVASCEAHSLTVFGNFLDVPTENVMTGGCAPLIVGNHPTDIDVRGNFLSKRPQWDMFSPLYYGYAQLIKNLVEFKHCERCLVEGNKAWNNWGSQGQDGHTILLGAGNQSGSDITSYQRNITFANNDIRRAESGFNGVVTSYGFQTLFNRNIKIENNLLVMDRSLASYDPNGQAGDCFTYASGGMPNDPIAVTTVANLPSTGTWSKELAIVTDGVDANDCSVGGGSNRHFCRFNAPGAWVSYSGLRGNSKFIPFYNFNILHNTCYSVSGRQVFQGTAYPGFSNSTINGNLLEFGFYGWQEWDNWESGSTTGDAALANGFVSSTIGTNYLIGSNPGSYTSFNFIANDAAVKWANVATGDFRLCTAAGTPDASCTGASPAHNACDGGTKDCGADIPLLNSIVASVTDPVTSPPTISSISPTHGTKVGGVTVTITGTGFSSSSVIILGGYSNASKYYMGFGGNFGGLPIRPSVTYTGSGTALSVALSASYPLNLYVGDQVYLCFSGHGGPNGPCDSSGGTSLAKFYSVASVTDTTHFTVTVPSGAPASDTGSAFLRSVDGTLGGIAGVCTPTNTGSWTSTSIQCITPAINMGTGRPMNLHVIEKAHWATYQSYTLD